MLLRAGGGARKSRLTIIAILDDFLPQAVPSAVLTEVDFTTAANHPSILVDTEGAADLANNQIIVPAWAKFVTVTGHIAFEDQTAVGAANGVASLHLFRNHAATTDLHYHVRTPYLINIGTYTSLSATTGKIPVQSLNENWSMRAFQNTGQASALILVGGTGPDQWLSVEFFER